MVRKGMNQGDTFQDGGRWFEVLAVNENGTYSSRQVVSGASRTPPPTEGEAGAGELPQSADGPLRPTATSPACGGGKEKEKAEEPKAVRRGRKKKQ